METSLNLIKRSRIYIIKTSSLRMKIVMVVLLLFLIQSAGAVTLQISDSYQPKETVIGTLEGNILGAISKEQVNI